MSFDSVMVTTGSMQLHALEHFVGFCPSGCLCLHTVAACVAFLFDSVVHSSILCIQVVLCAAVVGLFIIQ